MANLAIRGHATRSKEVIEILEMLGGTNRDNCWGVFDNRLYLINDSGNIEDTSLRNKSNYQVYTIEEFLEKFPYKVGDRVRVAEYESEVRISNIHWDGCGVRYEVVTDEVEWYSAKELNEFNEPNKPYKEQETMEEPTINLSPEQLGGAQIIIPIPKGYEFAGVDDDNKQVVFEKIKPKYPKTHEECCDVLGIPYMQLGVSGYKCEILHPLQQLLLYLDAYWKIAGEQMGLGKPWSPSKNDNVYCIFRLKGEIVKDNFVFGDSLLLEFPTEEMRDAFYENFKSLIEECKELL